MKKIPFLILALLMIAGVASAAVLCYQVQVDQSTKVYVGTDSTNYTIQNAGSEKEYLAGATQAVFKITSSASTATPNLRIGFQTQPNLKKDAVGVKLQGCTVDVIGNYYLTKSTTIPLN